MVKALEMKAEARDQSGTAAARNIRRTGVIPGIIYGGGENPIQITVSTLEIEKYIHKAGFFSKIFDVDVAGKKQHVLPRDVQTHPVTDRPMHVDFMRVTDKTKIHVEVHLKFINQDKCKALSQGGLLNIVAHEVEVICEAGNIPQELTVDVEKLEIGDVVHVSTIQLPAGVKIVGAERDFTIATMASAAMAEEEEPTAPVDAASVPTQNELDKAAKEADEAAHAAADKEKK